MKILADEGVDKPIVDLPRISGFDAHYILETHGGIHDDQVLKIANDEGRILITQDKDFGEMVLNTSRDSSNTHGLYRFKRKGTIDKSGHDRIWRQIIKYLHSNTN